MAKNYTAEAEAWAIDKMKKDGLPEKADCQLCHGGRLATDATTDSIVPCPICEGKGYRDNKAMMVALYLSGCR